MDSSGSRLKKIRLEKGITIEEAHKQTKIHLNILKAIEEDSVIGLSPIYIKGFLKIYCKFLGVDPKDYISGYQEPQSTAAAATFKLKKQIPFLKAAYLRLGSLRVPKIKIKTVFIIICALSLLIGLFILGKSISSRPSSAQLKKNKLPRVQKSQIRAPTKKEVLSELKLTLRAKEDCWVNLKADGQLVFHTLLKKGKFESWQAKHKIEFSLGNAGAIDLELNNRLIPSLGRRGQAIRNVVITKEEGLVVPR